MPGPALKRGTALLSVALWALGPGVRAADEALYLELSRSGNRVDVGLAEFKATRSQPDDQRWAGELRSVFKKDILFPQVFNVVEGGPAVAPGRPAEGWTKLGVDVVAHGVVDTATYGQVRLTGHLTDVGSGQTLLTKKYTEDLNHVQRAAHLWADDVIRYFTGKPGIASSRIVFVNDATGKKELCAVDYDGAHFQRLSNDRSIALFPKISADGRTLVYTTFREGAPAIYSIKTDGSDRRALCRFEGLNSAAAWFPDGKSLVATLSLGRDPHLYVIDASGKILRTLTSSSAADTAPAISPDGLRVAFTSDRSGPPQIYTMDVSGADLRRITSGAGQCDSPAWSPEGDRLSFTMSLFKGNFDIYTMEAGTGRQTRLTFGEGDNENSAWSPDGRWLVFSSNRRGKPELWIMGADGSHPRPVGDIAGGSYTPNWGY
jgi:TolB protein